MLEQNLCRYPLENRILSQSCLKGIFGRPYGFASFYIAFFTCLFIEELPNDPTSASQGMSAICIRSLSLPPSWTPSLSSSRLEQHLPRDGFCIVSFETSSRIFYYLLSTYCVREKVLLHFQPRFSRPSRLLVAHSGNARSEAQLHQSLLVPYSPCILAWDHGYGPLSSPAFFFISSQSWRKKEPHLPSFVKDYARYIGCRSGAWKGTGSRSGHKLCFFSLFQIFSFLCLYAIFAVCFYISF